MITRLKNLRIISTAGLVMAGLVTPVLGNKAGDAPLVRGIEDLRTLSQKLVEVSEPSAAATVSLVSERGGGAGSGVIVSEDGLILTAAHVVASLSDEVIILFPDGRRKKARKLGGDFDRDAAMVQITEEGKYPHVEVGKKRDLLRNEWCVALGHPGGFDPMRSPPVRLGRVLDDGFFVTTDCAVVGGDSGGPLFDVDGRVIGIHSNIGATLTENRHVPIGVFLDNWEDMKAGKKTGRRFAGPESQVDPNRPVLGIRIAGAADEGGVQLEGVMGNSPAAEAGLQAGDVVLRIEEKAVNDPRELVNVVSEFAAGDELKIVYRRDGNEAEVKVKLARLGDLLEDEAAPAAEEQAEEQPRKRNGRRARQRAEKAREEFEQLLKDSLKEGQLELGERQLEEIGGVEELQRLIEELAEQIGPEQLQDLLRMEIRGEPDRFFESSMTALKPVTDKAARSVVEILVDGKVACLGTVVSGEGHILAKNTETMKGAITRVVGDKGKVALELVMRFPKRDLALFKGPAEGLEPVEWADQAKQEPIGTLLTTPAPSGDPLGIGLVSVLTRALGDIGFLGIIMGEDEQGVRIEGTSEDGPARKAGLRRDDVITKVDGEAARGIFEFGNRIRSYSAGETVKLTYRRGDEEKQLEVTLAARAEDRGTERFRRMNEMSGPLSAKLSGFPKALQHDIPINPADCGGPLIDLDGRCIGINVARAGRVKTLAIPVGDVLALLEQAKGLPAEGASAADTADAKDALMKKRAKLMEELRAVEERLKDVDRQLEELN